MGLAVLRVLERAGHPAEFPAGQTCCGQPLFNTGHRAVAVSLARRTIQVLQPYDAVIVPSGSCTAMIRAHYASLFDPADPARQEADALAAKTFEFSEFLVKKLGLSSVAASCPGKVTYHEGCHLARELGIRAEPRALLRQVHGAELVEMDGVDQCCGFGGSFSVKYDRVSTAMGNSKIESIKATGAPTVVSCDPSCLLHLGGLLRRQGVAVTTRHLAEILAAENKP